MERGKNRYLVLIALFGAGFILAFVIAWFIFAKPEPIPAAPAVAAAQATGVLTSDDMRGFFDSVKRRDFAAMRDLGGDLFKEGVRIADSATVFAGYETNSFPPLVVYALHVGDEGDKTRRVLLTLDADGRVASFLAEEMTIMR